jgi:hypothetical protein
MLFGQAGFGVNAFANFNVTTGAGAVGTVGSSASASIVDVGNGWYRCTMTATSTASSSSVPCQMNIVESTSALRAPEITLNSGTIFLWGAQLEQRSAVTAYTPTTTQPITNYVPVLLSSADNVARFDHNPVTGESLGLLIEESRTNLVLRSEEFNNASWSKSNSSVTANVTVAPDGSLTADKLAENTADSTHLVISSPIAVTSGTLYTGTVYIKAAERSFAFVVFGTGGSPALGFSGVSVNLLTGAMSVGAGAITSLSSTAVGNGWYRVSITASANSTGNSNFNVYTGFNNVWTNRIYTGDGYSGIYIWGAQVEAGSFSTSYIPTVAAQVTRSNDTAVMTGENFSNWFRADEGTLYTELQVTGYSSTSNPRLVALAGVNQATNKIEMFVAGASPNYRAVIRTNNVDQLLQNVVSASNLLDVNKWAIAYKTDDSVAFGRTVNATDTSVTLPVITLLNFGSSTSAVKHIRKIAYYPKRLANAELQALTQN